MDETYNNAAGQLDRRYIPHIADAYYEVKTTKAAWPEREHSINVSVNELGNARELKEKFHFVRVFGCPGDSERPAAAEVSAAVADNTALLQGVEYRPVGGRDGSVHCTKLMFMRHPIPKLVSGGAIRIVVQM